MLPSKPNQEFNPYLYKQGTEVGVSFYYRFGNKYIFVTIMNKADFKGDGPIAANWD